MNCVTETQGFISTFVLLVMLAIYTVLILYAIDRSNRKG